MKALWLKAPNEMSLSDIPEPEISTDEVLVKVCAAAICHTDIYTLRGQNPVVTYPIVPGHEFSGVVEKCGSSVKLLKPGDRVSVQTILGCGQCRNCHQGRTTLCKNYSEFGTTRNGGFEEKLAVPARYLIRIADHMTFEEAALAEPAANAFSAVSHARIEPGDNVAVIGPGPVGLLALQFAMLKNPKKLILIGTRETRLALGRKLGATDTINIRQEEPLMAVRDILNGAEVDVVLQCAGTLDATKLALKIAGENGRIAVEGTTATLEKMEIAPNYLVQKALTVFGVRGWSVHEFAKALEIMEMGLIDLKRLITHRFSLEEYKVAFESVNSHKDEVIKAEFVF